MYKKYTTEGFLIDTRAIGETNVLCLVFTEDFGLIRAKVSGYKKSNSKLRPSIIQGSILKITLIRGKEYWMIVDVTRQKEKIKISDVNFSIFRKVIALIKLLIHGEDKNQRLFDILKNIYEYLLENNDKNIKGLECVVILKVIDSLGYGDSSNLAKDIVANSCSLELSEKAEQSYKELSRIINSSLRASHL